MLKSNGTKKINVSVFFSGKGTNLKNLIKFSKKKNSKFSIKLIISNNTPGLLEIKITNELAFQYIRMYPFDQPTDNKTANSMSSVVKKRRKKMRKHKYKKYGKKMKKK